MGIVLLVQSNVTFHRLIFDKMGNKVDKTHGGRGQALGSSTDPVPQKTNNKKKKFGKKTESCSASSHSSFKARTKRSAIKIVSKETDCSTIRDTEKRKDFAYNGGGGCKGFWTQSTRSSKINAIRNSVILIIAIQKKQQIK